MWRGRERERERDNVSTMYELRQKCGQTKDKIRAGDRQGCKNIFREREAKKERERKKVKEIERGRERVCLQYMN